MPGRRSKFCSTSAVSWASLTAPVPKGQTVGRIEYSVNGVVYRSEPIVTSEAVEEIDLVWCLEQVFHRFLIREGQQNGA